MGQLEPNAFGLFDMHGNVWEWVADSYGSYPTTDVQDSLPSPGGILRVMRGGSWDTLPMFCRSAHRVALLVGPGLRPA